MVSVKELTMAEYRVAEVANVPQLWGRVMGRAVRAQLEERLEVLPAGDRLLIDLKGVEVFDVSFAAEAFGRLIGGIAAAYADRGVVFTNIEADSVYDNLNAALDLLGLMALVVYGPRKWVLVGKAAETDKATMDALRVLKQATAPEIADKLGIKLTACNQRLRKLLDNGVVVRAKEAGEAGGESYIYRWLG